MILRFGNRQPELKWKAVLIPGRRSCSSCPRACLRCLVLPDGLLFRYSQRVHPSAKPVHDLVQLGSEVIPRATSITTLGLTTGVTPHYPSASDLGAVIMAATTGRLSRRRWRTPITESSHAYVAPAQVQAIRSLAGLAPGDHLSLFQGCGAFALAEYGVAENDPAAPQHRPCPVAADEASQSPATLKATATAPAAPFDQLGRLPSGLNSSAARSRHFWPAAQRSVPLRL